MIKHIFRYLKGRIKYGMLYWSGESNALQGFVNAN
jgi:hypothetical protein